MPGTRTAPALTGAASHTRLSITAVDANGDSRSQAIIVSAAATAAQLEAIVAEQQLLSNASVWEVTQSIVWQGSRQKTNALSEVYLPIETLINYYIKSGINTAQNVYLPSPIETAVVAGTDLPDTTVLSNWFAAVLAAATGYTGRSVSFTRHKESNNDNKVVF